MRVLLDTHALIWWPFDDPNLPATWRCAIADPDDPVFREYGTRVISR